MSKTEKKSGKRPKVHKKSEFKLRKDPKSGMLVLIGPEFTKEDIDKAFPEDPEDRVAKVMRRSVGLWKKILFDTSTNIPVLWYLTAVQPSG